MLRFWSNKSSGFADAMLASFPMGLEPPEPLVRLFRWQEANRLDRIENGERYAILDPAQTDLSMYIMPVDPSYADTWLGEAVVEEKRRLAPFARTGGDGSIAALWRDDAGITHIVHMGSGSGSTMLGILTSNAVDFLRLLAIGYDEICWPDDFPQTPAALHLENWGDDEDNPYVPLNHFKRWIERSFNVTVPATAAEIIGEVAYMDADQSDDPFWQWLRAAQGWPRND